jgi:hypothetical protein
MSTAGCPVSLNNRKLLDSEGMIGTMIHKQHHFLTKACSNCFIPVKKPCGVICLFFVNTQRGVHRLVTPTTPEQQRSCPPVASMTAVQAPLRPAYKSFHFTVEALDILTTLALAFTHSPLPARHSHLDPADVLPTRPAAPRHIPHSPTRHSGPGGRIFPPPIAIPVKSLRG